MTMARALYKLTLLIQPLPWWDVCVKTDVFREDILLKSGEETVAT
jgi:hypothetical protein